MGNLEKPERQIFDRMSSFVKSPVTEMVLGASIDLGRNPIFSLVHQYTGEQLFYSVIQFSIIIIAWILVGHGALRYSPKTGEAEIGLNHYNSSTSLNSKINLRLMSLILATFIITKFISF